MPTATFQFKRDVGFRASPRPPHLTRLTDLTPMPGAIPYDLSRLSKIIEDYRWFLTYPKKNLCARDQAPKFQAGVLLVLVRGKFILPGLLLRIPYFAQKNPSLWLS